MVGKAWCREVIIIRLLAGKLKAAVSQRLPDAGGSGGAWVQPF